MPNLDAMTQLVINQRNILDRLARMEALEYASSDDPGLALTRTMSAFLTIPGLRCFWPGNAVESSGKVVDLLPDARHLVMSANADLALDANGFAYMRGLVSGSHDFYTTDHAATSITGTESYIGTAARGVTVGCWVMPGNTGVAEGVIDKWLTTGDQRSYRLSKNTSDAFYINMDQTGAGTTTTAVTSSLTATMDAWHLVIASLDPSTTLDIYVGAATDSSLTNDSDTSSVISQVYDGTATLHLANLAGSGSYLEGGISMAFLAVTYMPELFANRLFAATRALYA